MVSLRSLKEPYFGYIWGLPATQFLEVLPATGWAAVRVGAFWALTGAVFGGFLLRLDAELGLFDAIFGGVICTWIFAYVGGNLLGPIGLFRAWTIWLMLLAGLAILARNPPRIELRRPSTGLNLALLACVLMAIGVLPMQLGSPVPPYMDVLNNPASAQRVVTFHLYLSWDNDPYGHWSPGIQTPGLELFYALLAIGSNTPLAVLAETAATLPMMCLIIFATWRLGRVLIGDAAGGMATILLFATTIFMRGVQMRGTALAFVLVAGGVAFLLDQDRRPLRTGLGAMMLGTAFASHAIDAAFGLAIAAAAVASDLLEADFRNFLRESACLAGAILLAVPEFAVALVIRVPYPILPAFQAAGIAIIYLGARGLTPRSAKPLGAARWFRRSLILAILALLVFHPSGITRSVRESFPILAALCAAGLLIAATVEYPRASGTWVAAFALAIADLAQNAVGAGLHFFPAPQAQFGLNDIVYKLQEYWGPYFLVFPAAVTFGLIYHRWSKTAAVALLLALVIFPWSEHPELDLNYHEHALADQWAVDWQTAKDGWWLNSPDHRWLQNPAEFALIEKLRNEIRAGRITPATHVIHIAPDSVIWKDELLYSLYTGIDDDLYLLKPGGNLNDGPTAGSRMHPVTMLPEALAENPPYIVVYQQAPAWMKLPPPGYEEIFHQGGLRLFRREGQEPKG